MRNLLFLIGIAFVAGSCSSLKSTSRSVPEVSRGNGQHGSQKFLNDIAITADQSPPAANRHETEVPHMPENHIPSKSYLFPVFNIEQGGPLQFKYAIKMDVEVERLVNRGLYKFIESWWGTPYRMGGATQRGVDCSAFTQTLMSVIYGLQIPRTASEQKAFSAVIGEDELREGDLIFFNTRGRGVSHVGIYLQDNKFVHAASSGGVMISSLNETYWHKRLISAGRVVDEQTAAAASLSSR
ncbi:C40 family peptidase [Agriterribacter sp.]|uniref:C40 family peptidase n=1 Tax=Agriterribacter sp. TaxID=2821509 RepID=UPI002B566BB9|nr:NlpC/P60 family protein [Agriterribacter sp.]HTN06128.1 NlpC/P60 family protein [Agriterribacter sp.]